MKQKKVRTVTCKPCIPPSNPNKCCHQVHKPPQNRGGYLQSPRFCKDFATKVMDDRITNLRTDVFFEGFQRPKPQGDTLPCCWRFDTNKTMGTTTFLHVYSFCYNPYFWGFKNLHFSMGFGVQGAGYNMICSFGFLQEVRVVAFDYGHATSLAASISMATIGYL